MRRSNIRAWYRLAACITPILGVACAELNSPRQSTLSAAALTGAFSTVPVGFGDVTSSFVGTSAASVPQAGFWLGGGREGSLERGSLMGGGLAANYSGEGEGFGRGFGNRGPFGGGLPCTATFNASTGRVACVAETRNGLTINRSAQYKDASGAVQQAFDSTTTNSVNIQSNVTGTVTYTPDSTSDRGRNRGPGGGGRPCWGDGRGLGGLLLGDTATIVSATTSVNNASDRTVTGLAKGSTQRSVNGTSKGQESTTGESSRGKFTATRVVGDTTAGVVIPVSTDGSKTYPSAGTVIREIRASLTYEGQAATTVTRREVVTYDGSATAKVVITENGTTKNCTRPLPRGPLTCS
jgi:hypothetical protein